MNMVSLSINDNEDESWKNYGSRKRRPHALQIQDIQLAFINDITQHEKMVLAVRKLMSELADCHNALGRCLDTIWKFHCSTMVVVVQQEMIMMEQAQQPEQQHMLAVENVNSGDDEEGVVKWEEGGDDDDDDGGDNSITNIVQLVTDVYHMLSTEIYRKQALVLELIESSGGDETLLLGVVETRGRNKSRTINERLLSSQQIAQKICTVWSSKSANESYIDMSIITRLFDIVARRR